MKIIGAPEKSFVSEYRKAMKLWNMATHEHKSYCLMRNISFCLGTDMKQNIQLSKSYSPFPFLSVLLLNTV